MLRYIISVIITILLAYGVYTYFAKPDIKSGDPTQVYSPTQAVEGTQNAVQKTQNFQKSLNHGASDVYGQ